MYEYKNRYLRDRLKVAGPRVLCTRVVCDIEGGGGESTYTNFRAKGFRVGATNARAAGMKRAADADASALDTISIAASECPAHGASGSTRSRPISATRTVPHRTRPG